ncbi:hypothetical protein IV203_031552 [Nitzschia inconspicua]|uniref:Uncharacterized protein n=1 Tax=Nitzschia inconspicua TaxID=303405 RepID=A0A9K3LUI1_9STRA|nr:hypothetical protein IV203_031552 [Nitzschia inconspicua]
MTKLKVQVQYCGGGLKKWLEEQPDLADQIEIEGVEDRGVTGNFEIRIGPDRKLIHSKRTRGQGRAESTQERAVIAELIQDYIDETQ